MLLVELPGLPPPDTNLEKRIVFNGVELADDALLVTDYGAVLVQGIDLDGWDGATDSTGTGEQHPYGWGEVPSDYPQATARVLTLKVVLIAESPAAMREVVDRLNAAASLADFQLVHDEWGLRRSVTARRQGAPQTDRTEAAVVKGWSCQLRASDPRKYGDTIRQSTGLPNVSGGIVGPLVGPVRSDASTATGIVTITNVGNAPAGVRLRIDGPIVAPRIVHAGSGQVLAFASSYTVPAGSWLDVDLERHEVIEAGQVSRAQYVTSRGWFEMETNEDGSPCRNDFLFSADVYNASARLTVVTAPAWQ